VVLVTAGASAPEGAVQDCLRRLEERFGAVIENRVIREEDVHFPLPKALRVLAASA
jgi:4-hydroxy-3-methylbut-2-enyl diphosphate reductase